MFHQERRNLVLSILVVAAFPFVCFLAGYVVTLLSAGVGILLATAWSRWWIARLFDAGDRPSVLPEFWYSLILWGTTMGVGLGGIAIPILASVRKSPESAKARLRVRGYRATHQPAQRLRRRLIEDALVYALVIVVFITSFGLSAVVGWYFGEFMVAVALTVGLAIGGYFSTASLNGGYVLGILGLVFAVVAWFRASNITVALAGARTAAAGDGPFLDLVGSVALGAGISTPEARVLDGSAPEIFSVGSAKHRGTILVSSGLLQLLTRRELEAVVAHESVHIRNGDGRLTATLMALFGCASMLSRRLLKFSDRELEKNVLVGLFVAWLGLMARLVGDVFGILVKAAFGRTRELLADAQAIEVTRDPAALIAALKKMESNGEVDTATRKTSSVSSLLATHSLLRERLRALDAIAAVRET